MSTISEVFGIRPPKVINPASFAAPEGISFPELVMGTEIEAEQLENDNGHYLYSMSTWLNVVEDGSLRGINVGRNADNVPGYAYEFLPKPMPQGKLMAALDVLYHKANLGEKNFSDRTSMHVHVNYTDKTLEQLQALVTVYPVIEDVLFEFVGVERAFNNYCIPWKHSLVSADLINTIKKNVGDVPATWKKYSALNLQPLSTLGTVEFRHMGGCPDLAKAKQWLNVLGAVVKYASETPVQEITDTVFNLNNFSQYEAFFRSVFKDTIPYDDKYRATLETGVMMAKYSAI